MRRLPALAVLLLVPLTACGGDGTPSLEERRAEYVSRAEQVCREANEKAAEVAAPTSVAEVPAAADRVVAIARETLEQVAALDPPEEDRAEVQTKVLDPLQADVGVAEDYAEQVKAAAAAGDTATLLRLVSERPQTTADLAFMRDYGFVECVKAADQTD